MSAFSGMLVGVTAMLAMQTGIDEIATSEPEIDAFLKAAQNVARHYSVETTQVTLDWVAFAGIGLQVFGTRAVAISARLAKERKTAGKPAATLHAFPGGGGLAAPGVPPGPIEEDYGG